MIQGPGKEIYQVGMGGDKGHDGSEEKLYCQVSISAQYTLLSVQYTIRLLLNARRHCSLMTLPRCLVWRRTKIGSSLDTATMSAPLGL